MKTTGLGLWLRYLGSVRTPPMLSWELDGKAKELCAATVVVTIQRVAWSRARTGLSGRPRDGQGVHEEADKDPGRGVGPHSSVMGGVD